MTKLIRLGIGIFCFLYMQNAFADWINPAEVLHGSWGSMVGQFGFVNGDPADGFPTKIMIDKNNNILIQDLFNKRVQVYKTNGKITIFSHKELNPGWEIMQWPSDIPSATGFYNNIFVEGGFGKFQYYDYQGNIINQYKVVDCILKQVNEDGSLILMNYKTEKYFHYSPTGQLLKTYDTQPLELGIVKEQSLGGGKYKTTIQYPDKTYVTDRLTYHNYIRGCDNTLYATLYKEIVRYDADSKLTAELVMPETEYKIIRPAGGGFNEVTELIVEYGDPVLAPNGDVYTWKRTTDKYSIIKWVWVDGPECPQYLDVTPTKNSLKFTWQKPTKDVDKVTGYQLLQSYNICGPFRQTALLKKDQLSYEDRDVKKGETYYYIVKAVRGNEYSGNSNKVCGQVE